jgi:molecular chaperone DnaK (HSP70)
VLAELCREMGQPFESDEDEEALLWRRLMLAEACRVKEAVFFQESAEFLVAPAAGRGPRVPGAERVALTRARLSEILTGNGFFKALGQCIDRVLDQSKLGADAVEEVLLVGGSTLLPGVFPMLEGRFGRPRLRAWQPFEAVPTAPPASRRIASPRSTSSSTTTPSSPTTRAPAPCSTR